jgi:hypothetical protein
VVQQRATEPLLGIVPRNHEPNVTLFAAIGLAGNTAAMTMIGAADCEMWEGSCASSSFRRGDRGRSCSETTSGCTRTWRRASSSRRLSAGPLEIRGVDVVR